MPKEEYIKCGGHVEGREDHSQLCLGWEPDAEKVLVAGESHLRNSDKQLLIT